MPKLKPAPTPYECAYRDPEIRRVICATCERCGKYSRFCVQVVWRLARKAGQPQTWSAPQICCTGCRLACWTRWAVAAGWHDGIPKPTPEPQLQGDAMRKWKAANPPLTEEQIAAPLVFSPPQSPRLKFRWVDQRIE